jgi:flavin-dependent dehydrogenase
MGKEGLMVKRERVHVLGAGLSGMVAAYNLARDGHDVLVLEKSPGIGGAPPHHPSNHATPLAVGWLWDYIGIDLSGFFHRPQGGELYIERDRFSLPTHNRIVERGARETAIDGFLHARCLEAGVRFQFGEDVQSPLDLPDPTIIATGLHKDMGQLLSRPMQRLPCFSARRKLQSSERDRHNFAWLGDYTRTYGYCSVVNELEYFLLFSNDEIGLPELRRFEEHVDRSLGVRLDHWDYFEVWVPLGSPNAPRLYAGSKILAGTIAGVMCPQAYFGIHGAMISGKIAAMAVTDPERALREMDRMTRNYRSAYRSRQLGRWLPLNRIQQLALKHPFLGTLLPRRRSSIPGMADEPPGPAPEYRGRI